MTRTYFYRVFEKNENWGRISSDLRKKHKIYCESHQLDDPYGTWNDQRIMLTTVVNDLFNGKEKEKILKENGFKIAKFEVI